MAEERKPIPLTVIGGFLGAGKTTLVNHVLRRNEDLRLGVLVNDFGAVNIDARLIARHDGETIELANGCVCCSLAGGLTEALISLERLSRPIDHAVVEASGVSDPRKIMQIGFAASGYAANATIVLADAQAVRTHAADRYVGDTVLRQLAGADIVVANKMDLLEGDEGRGLRAWLEEAAGGAPVIETSNAEVPLSLLLGPGEGRPHEAEVGTEPPSPQHGFETHAFVAPEPVDRVALETAVAALPSAVLRGKGIMRFRDAPARWSIWQRVGRRTAISDTDAPLQDGPSSLVLIGAKGALDVACLERLLEPIGFRRSS